MLPDPAGHGINQLFIDYSGVTATRIRAGRQILRIDNQRFVSDVDFRQTPQVFDGLTVITHALPDTEILLGQYRRMRSVVGKVSRLRLSILHAAWNPAPDHSLALYGYWHDTPATGTQTGFANNAQRIVGAKAEGLILIDGTLKLSYYAEFARQGAIGGGDPRISANYARVGGGVVGVQWGARLDHEVKGSNRGVYGFQTPLTDLYAFNGTALQFTSTPPQGLRDTWLTLRGEIAKFDCFTEYHRYRSDFGGLQLGREWDASAVYPVYRDLRVKLQIARFRGGDGARIKSDVDKTWLALSYTY